MKNLFENLGRLRGHMVVGFGNPYVQEKRIFWKCIRFKFGRGDNISLWIDLWVGMATLREKFPNIYQLALDPQAPVALCYDDIKRIWCLRLRRDPNDWGLGEMLNLLEILGNIAPNINRDDGCS